MTIYKYLKSKYGKRIVKQIFDSNSELNKSKAIGIIGVRGSGSTTIQALEIVLSKIVFGVEYNVMTKEEVIELLQKNNHIVYDLTTIYVENNGEKIDIELTVNNFYKSINYTV